MASLTLKELVDDIVKRGGKDDAPMFPIIATRHVWEEVVELLGRHTNKQIKEMLTTYEVGQLTKLSMDELVTSHTYVEIDGKHYRRRIDGRWEYYAAKVPSGE